MGGDSQQPYIYEPQNRRVAYPYSDFNPRAVTQASYQKLQNNGSPKKQDGPLINFNQHPDSYMIVPGTSMNHKPMAANTKKKVTAIRWTQFGLRIHEEIGALGMLVMVICLRNMVTSMSWIMRIAPAWDAVITIYAIYHLARSPKARPPMSSASYHMFSIFMDCGLIPFYVFIGIFANNNYQQAPGTEGRWTSFFTAEGSTTLLLLVTFITSFTMAGFHAISAVIDVWLVVLFRKIAKLPPDQNPLEDNLTSRKASKHKHKNSELTLTEPLNEKNAKYMSGSTLSVDQRSRLSTAPKDVPDARQVPFRHSRTGSELGYSPHNPDSVRWSQQQFEGANLYQEPQAGRGSFASVRSYTHRDSIDPSRRGSFATAQTSPTKSRANPPISLANSRAGTNMSSTPARYSVPAMPNAAPTNDVVRSQQQDGLLENNWVTLDDDVSDLGTPERRNDVHPGFTEHHPLSQIDRHDSFQPEPLKMNPPTPPPVSKSPRFYSIKENRSALSVRQDNGNADLSRHLTVKSDATASSSVYSESAPSLEGANKGSPASPKRKYYGDLAAATRGVRGNMKSNATLNAAGADSTGMSAMGGYGFAAPTNASPSRAAKAYTTNSPSHGVRSNVKSNDTLKSNATVDVSGMDSTGMSALGGYGFAPSPPPKQRDRNSRVASRTGADIADANVQAMDFGFAQSRRRDVSGKVAEEGRGGQGQWGGWRGR